jgi:hypothetical protein
VVTFVVSALPYGGAIGVESVGFVPPGFSAGDAAYVADRFSKSDRHRARTASCACRAKS